jgi:hypothetical protein
MISSNRRKGLQKYDKNKMAVDHLDVGVTIDDEF